MEGNQSRTIANALRLSMRSGTFWLWFGLLLLISAVAGPYVGADSPAQQRQEQRHVDKCHPLDPSGLSDDARATLLGNGYRELQPGMLYPPGCDTIERN